MITVNVIYTFFTPVYTILLHYTTGGVNVLNDDDGVCVRVVVWLSDIGQMPVHL